MRFSKPTAAQGGVHRRRTPLTLQAFPRTARGSPTSRPSAPQGSRQQSLRWHHCENMALETVPARRRRALQFSRLRKEQRPRSHSAKSERRPQHISNPRVVQPRGTHVRKRRAIRQPLLCRSPPRLLDRMRQQRRQLRRAFLFIRNGISSRTKLCSDLVANRCHQATLTAPAASPPQSNPPARAKRRVPGAAHYQTRDSPCSKVTWEETSVDSEQEQRTLRGRLQLGPGMEI